LYPGEMRGGRIQLWVAAAAAAVGVLIAFAASHRAPPWWLLALLLVAPLLITWARTGRPGHASGVRTAGGQPGPGLRRRGRLATGEQRHDGVRGHPAERVGPPGSGDDSDAIGPIHDAFDERRVRWLRTNEFNTPWLHAHVQPLVGLRPLLIEITNGSGSPQWGRALGPLAGAVDRFVDFYTAHTSPDPMVVGEEWRFFDWDTDSTEVDSFERLGDGQPAELRTLALEVANTYEAFAARVPPRDADGKGEEKALARRSL
jgi:hypothetical protein